MLVQAHDREAAIQALAGDRVRGFTVRNFCRLGEDNTKPIVLVNDQAHPSVMVAHAGSNCMIYGAIHRYHAVLEDLLHGRVEQEDGWPDEELARAWSRGEEGQTPRRHLFLNSNPFAVWRAACTVGFEPNPEDSAHAVAWMWHFDGPPRFAHLVRHPCRMADGLELLELLKQGIGYDPEGRYITQCLQHGPSFVCEVDGAPVCWSCTHLNGTMGMIYTPEQHRRQGYARSLAAFQIDAMLARDGIACCHVIDTNVASMSMVHSLGAQRWEEALVWRVVFWPEAASK
jgi:hypothetical protein